MADSHLQVDVFRKTVKWEELAPLPMGHSVHTAVLLGGNVYVGGGFKGTGNYRQCCYRNRIDVYNLTTILISGALLLSLHHTITLV